MGVDSTIYIGPFVKARNAVVPAEWTETGCPKCKKPMDASSSFCPTCGNQKGEYKKKGKTNRINTYELSEEIGQKLLPVESPYGNSPVIKNFDTYTPNVELTGFGRPTSLDGKHGSDTLIPVNPEQITTEIELFKKQFSKELEIIEKAYGSIEIGWGVLLHFT